MSDPERVLNEVHQTGDLSQSRTPLVALCGLAAIYGLGFGLAMLPVALFTGPHLLIGAMAHMALGAVYLTAGLGVRSDQRWGYWLITCRSCVVAGIGLIAVVQAWGSTSGIVFWSLLSLFFLVMAGASFRATPRREHDVDPE
ncbi:MAG: hypothetical protein H0T47_03640 [Planctomycetaceae bacterium]|nr:hypothetical protein [Planctomycetaceae bacterium]